MTSFVKREASRGLRTESPASDRQPQTFHASRLTVLNGET